MNTYLPNYIDTPGNSYRDYNHKSKKVFDEQTKNREELEKVINSKISYFIKLAQYYYTDSSQESDEEEIEKNNRDDLYTLIKDPKDFKKDLLVFIKTDELPEAEDSEKGNSELKKYLNWPLPIFVVPHWIEKGGISNIKKFLDENTTIYYSPNRWWQIQLRNIKHKTTPIDYTHANIARYDEIIVTLQKNIVQKIFSDHKLFEKFVKKMKDLKTYTPIKLYQRSKDIHEYNQDEEDIKVYTKIRECLGYMSEWDNEKMFNLIQSFDAQKEIFVRQQ